MGGAGGALPVPLAVETGGAGGALPVPLPVVTGGAGGALPVPLPETGAGGAGGALPVPLPTTGGVGVDYPKVGTFDSSQEELSSDKLSFKVSFLF